MNNPSRIFLRALVAIVIGFPTGMVATWMIVPFWRWIEATTHVEAIGHSGPADWCFMAMIALATIGAFAVLTLMARRPT